MAKNKLIVDLVTVENDLGFMHKLQKKRKKSNPIFSQFYYLLYEKVYETYHKCFDKMISTLTKTQNTIKNHKFIYVEFFSLFVHRGKNNFLGSNSR